MGDNNNWFSPGKPVSGDDLTFNNSEGPHKFVYNDYGDYFQFGHINIYAGAQDGQFYGNALKFTDYIKNNDNPNQWRVYNSNVSARTSSGSTIYVIADGGGLNFKLDGSGGTGSGDGGHFYLDTLTLEVQGGAAATFQCIISDGNGTGNVTANNSNTVTFSGSSANTYSGTTTVIQGTLALSKSAGVNAIAGSSLTVNNSGSVVLWNNDNQINDSTAVTLNGGKLNTQGHSESSGSYNNLSGSPSAGMGALTLQSSSIIDLGTASTGGHTILAFADSHSQTWTGTLKIYNWTGIPAVGDGVDQLFFGSNASGLTASQLSSIQFYSDSGSTFLGTGMFAIDGLTSDGEVVPIPESNTWISACLGLATLAFSQRRRVSRLLKRRA
jgi:autotransporter-associated beta strand protein